MIGWCLVLAFIGLMSDEVAGQVKSWKVKVQKWEPSLLGGGAKGAWEGGLIIRGRRAEKSRVQRDQGCLIRADRQIIACGACRSLIEVAPSAERRVTRVTE